MKKLLNISTDRFVLNLLKGAGMILSCTLVAYCGNSDVVSCGNSDKESNKDGDQKSFFASKKEMIQFFIKKGVNKEEAAKKVTNEFFKKNKDNKDALKVLTCKDFLGNSEVLQRKINEEMDKILLLKKNKQEVRVKSTNNEAPSILLGDNERIKDGKYLPIRAGGSVDCVIPLRVVVSGYNDSIHEVVSNNENVKVIYDKDNSSIDIRIISFDEKVLVSTDIILRKRKGGKCWENLNSVLFRENIKIIGKELQKMILLQLFKNVLGRKILVI